MALYGKSGNTWEKSQADRITAIFEDIVYQSRHAPDAKVEPLDAAIRATCEQVLANFTVIPAQRLIEEGYNAVRKSLSRCERNLVETEAVSTRLRELAYQTAFTNHCQGLRGEHTSVVPGDFRFENCPHPDCMLVRVPHGEQP